MRQRPRSSHRLPAFEVTVLVAPDRRETGQPAQTIRMPDGGGRGRLADDPASKLITSASPPFAVQRASRLGRHNSSDLPSLRCAVALIDAAAATAAISASSKLYLRFIGTLIA